MSRYTNQDSLIDAIKMAFEDEEDGYQIIHGSYWNAEMVVSFIKDFPSADVVPVVRCGECRFYDPEWKFCQHHRTGHAPEYYCAAGRTNG